MNNKTFITAFAGVSVAAIALVAGASLNQDKDITVKGAAWAIGSSSWCEAVDHYGSVDAMFAELYGDHFTPTDEARVAYLEDCG